MMPSPLLLELDLTKGMLEAPAATPVEAVRSRNTPVLRSIIETLRKAASDDSVAGLVAHVGRSQPTLAQSSELRSAVAAFGRRGKPTVCWSESFGEMGPGNVAYHLATAFDEVWLQPTGDLGLTGVVAEAVFVRDALDKLGVDSQLGQRHEYKTAANMFVQSTMTDAHREMASRLVSSAMETICADVADGRGLEVAAVRDAVDHAPLTGQQALERGLVDRLGYRDEVYDDLRARLGEVRLRYVDRYGKAVHQELPQTLTTLTTSARRLAARRHAKSQVAVVQASGAIHLGRSAGGSPLRTPSVGSDTIGAALRAAGSAEQVKAIVLRVDSPGGSYVASDAIRRQVLALRRSGKPVVASMASVAASGGYYIAMPADVVVANPGTLTGSIGVLAGKQVLKDAFAKIGVQRESVAAGAYAEMFSSQRRFSDDEWQRLMDWLDRIYDDFTGKAAQDRGMPVEALRDVAKGRVWTGADAHQAGLVDRLGGLSDAVDVACEHAHLDRDDVTVRGFPKTPLLERIRPAENSEQPAAAGLGTGLGAGVGVPLLTQLMTSLGLPAGGLLTMPVEWRLH